MDDLGLVGGAGVGGAAAWGLARWALERLARRERQAEKERRTAVDEREKARDAAVADVLAEVKATRKDLEQHGVSIALIKERLDVFDREHLSLKERIDGGLTKHAERLDRLTEWMHLEQGSRRRRVRR